jgi:hypothetical protein
MCSPELLPPSGNRRVCRVVCIALLEACRLVHQSKVAFHSRGESATGHVRHPFPALRHSTSMPYSQTLENQADNCIELSSSHTRSTVQAHSKNQHPLLLGSLHKNRTSNRRRQCLAHHLVVSLSAAQHCRSSEMCHRQQLIARIVVVEHSWVHGIGGSGGKWDVHPMREFAGLRNGEEDLVGERCTAYICNDVADEP